MNDADGRTETVEETTAIIQEIESRLAAHGYWTLTDGARNRINYFLEWARARSPKERESSNIALRPRTNHLFGNCSVDGKPNFKAENLYAELFEDIEKQSDNCVACPLKFDITLNKEITNQSLIEESGNLKEVTDEPNPDDGTCYRYAVVTLGKVPVLYLLYIDPARDFDFVD